MSRTGDELRAAIAVLERHGWAQGWVRTPDGKRCLLGALCTAGAHRDAFDAVQAQIGGVSVAAWNDQPGRTVCQVTDLLFRVALARDGAS